MIAFVALIAMLQDQEPPVERTPAIYRCPAVEAESDLFPRVVRDYDFDSYCIEPKPGAKAKQAVKEAGVKVKFVGAKTIDTKANLAWRNATIDFVNGKISPKDWLAKTKSAKATVHFLSNPKTPKLRDATEQKNSRAVFSEMLLLTWPGRICLTADDTWRTRPFPGLGKLGSWVLSMNDLLGPLLYGRTRSPYLVTQQPAILRADPKPGMLIYRYQKGKSIETFYLNNGPQPLELPEINLDQVTGISRGLDVDSPKFMLHPNGFVHVMEGVDD